MQIIDKAVLQAANKRCKLRWNKHQFQPPPKTLFLHAAAVWQPEEDPRRVPELRTSFAFVERLAPRRHAPSSLGGDFKASGVIRTRSEDVRQADFVKVAGFRVAGASGAVSTDRRKGVQGTPNSTGFVRNPERLELPRVFGVQCAVVGLWQAVRPEFRRNAAQCQQWHHETAAAHDVALQSPVWGADRCTVPVPQTHQRSHWGVDQVPEGLPAHHARLRLWRNPPAAILRAQEVQYDRLLLHVPHQPDTHHAQRRQHLPLLGRIYIFFYRAGVGEGRRGARIHFLGGLQDWRMVG